MQWLKKNKLPVLIGLCVVAVLGFAFWYGGDAPDLQGGVSAETAEEATVSHTPAAQAAQSNSAEEDGPTPAEKPTTSAADSTATSGNTASNSGTGDTTGDAAYSASQGMVIDPATGQDKYQTDPVPEGQQTPVNTEDQTVTDTQLTCTFSVRCDTILNNMDWLDADKKELVPADGVIYAQKTVTFNEGESVFDVLQRELKNANIQMEYNSPPAYGSAYIESINNLYEFDCGEQSGWLYSVNGWFPNYGSSRYAVKSGDVIAWVYTCNQGVDVGSTATN